MSADTFVDLDHNATTAIDPDVADCVREHSLRHYGNPGSRHQLGRAARRVLEDAREKIASLLNAEPDEVVLTSGGTEANNLAILGLATGQPGTIVTTAAEHPAVQQPVLSLVARGWRQFALAANADGLAYEDVQRPVPWDSVRLMAILWGHNETGVIQPLADWLARCRGHGVPLHLDATQMVGKAPVQFHETGAMTLAFAAHKFHGPRGVGVLLARRGMKLSPVFHGGFQEGERRPGTEPVALAAGMAMALEKAVQNLPLRRNHMVHLRNTLQLRLLAECPDAVVHGINAERLCNTLNMSFPGVPGEALLVALDLAGIGCSLGSACASGSAESAPILVAMGLPDELTRSAIRLSVGIDNTMDEIEHAAVVIGRTVREIRAR